MSLQTPRSFKVPVIIDTDPGVDDTIAILLALTSPELEILGFVISFGNTDADASCTNVFKIYQVIGRHLQQYPDDAPRFPNFDLSGAHKPFLVRGAEGPLEGDIHSAEYFHGRDGLANITYRHPDLELDSAPLFDHPQLNLDYMGRQGVEVALEAIQRRPSRSITWLALGPLTNIATAMRRDPETMRNRLGRVVCMGGALDVPGNTSPVAEFNFFADPFAVKELLGPLTNFPLNRFVLLPLDITTPHELRFPDYQARVDLTFESTKAPSVASTKPPVTHFTSSILEGTREAMLAFGKDAVELHDIVAVWCAIENPPVSSEKDNHVTLHPNWTAVRRKFDIERMGELTRGMLVVDRREDESAYAPGANRAEVQAEFEKQHTTHRPFESVALPAQVEVEETGVTIQNSGVWCITKTPGPDVLVELLLERVWGVDVNTSSVR